MPSHFQRLADDNILGALMDPDTNRRPCRVEGSNIQHVNTSVFNPNGEGPRERLVGTFIQSILKKLRIDSGQHHHMALYDSTGQS